MTWVRNTFGLTFHNHFVLCGIFCDCRCNGAMINTIFFVKDIRKGLRVTNPTQHLDRKRLRPRCLLFSGARVGWAHFIAEHDLSPQDWARAKENAISPPKIFLFQKKEWERERELQWRGRVVAHASVGYASLRSATCLHIIFHRAGEKELENAIYSPQLFLLWKKDFERASMSGDSCRKNLILLQAEAEKFPGFTPSIQPKVAGLRLYARGKTR